MKKVCRLNGGDCGKKGRKKVGNLEFLFAFFIEWIKKSS